LESIRGSAVGVLANGAQAFSNDITVDGVSVMGASMNEALVLPTRDGIAEVRTITTISRPNTVEARAPWRSSPRAGLTSIMHAAVPASE